MNLNNSRSNSNNNIGFRVALWRCQNSEAQGLPASTRQKGSAILAESAKDMNRRERESSSRVKLRSADINMPITHNNLFPKIYDFENLYQAYLLARKGKRYRNDAVLFRQNLEGNLIELQNELIWKTYKTGAYHYFTVHEPKERQIAALPFRDRVVQHALVRIIEPIWEARFIFDSYACRLGKGTHAGADRAQNFMRIVQRNEGKVFAFKADISKYFASIDHAVLKDRIRRHVSCRDTIWLIDGIIDSAVPGCGMPIGNLTSQLFANIYLHALDEFVKNELHERYYVRYVDDFCVLGPSKDRLHEVWRQVIEFLAVELGLTLNRKTQLFPIHASRGRALDFLGYRIWPTHRKLRKSSALRMRRGMKHFTEEFRDGRMSLSEVKTVIASWLGHAAHADAYNLRKSILGSVAFTGPR